MRHLWRAMLAGVTALAVAGCGGSSSNTPDVKSAGSPAGGAPAAGAPAAGAPAGMPGGMPAGMPGGMPAGMPGAAPGGNPAAAGQPAATGEATAAAGAGGDPLSYIPANLKMVVGAVIPALQRKDNPLGENLLSQLKPITAMAAGAGIKLDEIERVWAGSDRENGDMLVCVMTRGAMDPKKLTAGLKLAGKGEKIGRGTLYALPDKGAYRNAVAIVSLRMALIGRRSTVETALKTTKPGPAKLGLDAIAPHRPFYWMAGDDAFGQTHFEKAVFGMLKIRTADGLKLNSQGFAMGFADAGAASSGSNPASPMGSYTAGAAPGGYAPPGGIPMAGTPAAAGADPAAAVAGMPPVPMMPMGAYGSGAQPGGTAPAANAKIDLVLAASFTSEPLVAALDDDLKDLFKAADAADIARQEAVARAKSRPADDPNLVDPNAPDPAGKNGPGQPGAAPGGAPGMPPMGPGMPPGAVPPGAAPGMPPGGAAPGMPPGGIVPGMPPGGITPGGGGSYSSTITKPNVVKEKMVLRVVRPVSSDEVEQTQNLGWFGSFSKVAGFAPINDGIFQGTLEIVGTAMNTWATSKPGEFRGAIAVDNASRFAHHGWLTQLLPYLGREDIYVRVDFKKSPLDPKNIRHGRVIIPEFLNPAADKAQWTGYPFQGLALTHFVGMSGIETKRNDVAALLPRTDPRAGVFGYDEIAKPNQITDGQSQTISLIGCDRVAAPWILGGGATIRGARAPYFGEFAGFSSSGLQKPGVVVLFADGSSKVLASDIDPEVFKALCTIHGAETVDMGKINVADSK